MVQELLRRANSRITLDLYAQAGMPNKRLAQSRLVRMVLNKGRNTGLTGLNWTMIESANSLQVLERIGGDDETRTRDLLAGTTRLELATSAVTGQRSNQLNYVPTCQINNVAKSLAGQGFCKFRIKAHFRL